MHAKAQGSVSHRAVWITMPLWTRCYYQARHCPHDARPRNLSSTTPQVLETAPTFLEQLDQPSSYTQALTQTRCIDRAPCVLSPDRRSRFSFAVDSRFREQNPPVAYPNHGVPSCVILGLTLAAQALSRIYRVISASYRVIDKNIAAFTQTIPDGKLQYCGIARS